MTGGPKAVLYALGLCALIGAGGHPAHADTQDRFWILWEQIRHAGSNCPDGSGCRQVREYSSRLFTPDRTDWLYRMFGLSRGRTPGAGRAGERPDAPRVCQDTSRTGGPGSDPERQFLSESLDALRGLAGIGLDLRSLRPPPGFDSGFGADLQAEFERRFRALGLLVLDPREAARLPGQPKLNIFLSFTDPDGACAYSYSVFASLSQTALLSRDPATKLSVGVWSFSTKSSAEFADATEYDAVLRVLEAFERDFSKANDPE